MYKTTDGGNTWSLNFEIEEEINDFHFVDENNGYFIEDQRSLYKTNDGAESWHQFDNHVGLHTLVKFYTKNIGYVTNKYGRIYKTMNGGESWEQITTEMGTRAIEFVKDKIYTAGAGGRIYQRKVTYDKVVLHIKPAQEVSDSSALIRGNVTSNEGGNI